jgi:hypothetical protein
MWLITAVLAAAWLFSPGAFATTWFVNANATGANNGTSWTNACTLLQSALNAAASGDQIWVAAGTYAPTSDYGRGIGVAGNHFEMINGVSIYGGFAGTETLLSQRNWTTNVTTLSGGNTCYHVFYQDTSYNGISLNATAILDGFTITGGNANASGFPDNCGAGMFNYSCSPAVTHCTFSGNVASILGGGMYNYVYSSPIVANCEFTGNSTTDSGGGGGGMCDSGSSSTVTNCTFTGNSAAGPASGAGGMCIQESSSTVTNCTFSGNSATAWGGGMIIVSASPTVTNCIMWDDYAASGAPEVYNLGSSTPTFSYCDITGCGGSGGGWNSSIGTDGGNNIAADPLFVSAIAASSAPDTTGNYRLQAGSPCIGTGNSAAVPPGVTTDLDGNPRIVDGTVDMGAYEYQGPAALTVQSTPPTGIAITSDTGQAGTTNYTVPDVAYGTSVDLVAPATDPTGYIFSEWTVNGAAESAGAKSLTFTITTATTAVAQYTLNTYALTVQSSPPTGIVIASDTGQAGTTNYTVPSVGYGTSVDLTAPATDPTGYTFSQWTVNGAAQTAGQKSITFTMPAAATTAVAVYTVNTYALTVQSTPPTGIVITSDTGESGTTNYTIPGVAYGTSVDLVAPATDPTGGYSFSYWTLNGTSQTAGAMEITPTMPASAMTAEAVYTANNYTLTVQSTPPTGLGIGSGTGDGGTTDYTVPSVGYGTSVDLVAPATDPTGEYTFSYWTLNGTPQTAGELEITPTMPASATTAVAVYTVNILTVQSTPPTGIVIASSTGDGGTTNYGVPSVAAGASVNLVAPATDPTGYTFSKWTVNGAAETAGQKSITFKMPAEATTAVAQYTLNTYKLTVQSAPPTGLSIGSSTGDGGATNYTKSRVAYGASVNLAAPATDPTGGYSFSYWTLNGVSQTAGAMEITPTMPASATTAVAVYTANTYVLTVQSAPPPGIVITSSTADGGTTNYTVSSVSYGVSVNLAAPAAAAYGPGTTGYGPPATGYTFSKWTLSGKAQTAGQKSITFKMPAAATTAVAQYTVNTYKLTVQSTPPTGLSIGSSTGDGGTTKYTKSAVACGTSVNLAASAADPAGYTFSNWMVNGAAQTAGVKNITFAMPATATKAVAVFTVNTYTLTVQSTPPTGLSIGSSTSEGGTTNYTQSGVAYGTSVNLAAPATNPAGYTFSKWTVNGAAQTAGQKSITFKMPAGATTAAAQYTVNTYKLTVQSAPPTGLSIGSTTGDGGTTNYTKSRVAYGASVNLAAPATDPTGYTFSMWTVGGAAQTAGQKSITFMMPATATRAVAQYNALTVQSTPPTGIVITSSSGDGGTTNYGVPRVAPGASVNLVAPPTDPTGGYSFSYWTLNGTSQTGGAMEITFTMPAPAVATTVVAVYTPNTYALTVQSTPPTGIVISSSTNDGGTTNYTVPPVAYGTSVDLMAPATDPTGGYSFSSWTLNGVSQTPGLMEITPTMPASAMTAVAVYTVNTFALNVQSTPVTGTVITSDFYGGTTNYTLPTIAYGTSVDLTAPATDPSGDTFLQWTVNGVAQTAAQQAITFPMPAMATTAVAQYTSYTLTVQSTPIMGIGIASDTGQAGTTDYTVTGIPYGTLVDLMAPATDPTTGYSFFQWAVYFPGVPTPATVSSQLVIVSMAGDRTAVAEYTPNTYALDVQSTPPTGIAITSSTGDGGTTEYTVPTVAYATSVDLVAPPTDPTGEYTFSNWTLNGIAQGAGEQEITFPMPAMAVTAQAVYTVTTFALTVQSTPPTGIVITSGTGAGDGGTTNYIVSSILWGTSVDLVAPATDTTGGYSFAYWTLNDVAQTALAMEITPTLTAPTTAVAVYTANTYELDVQSTPPTGIAITSNTGDGGTTEYTVPTVAYGTNVDLVAPATDTTGGYSFSYWNLNGTPQPFGLMEITPTMPASALTAVAAYTVNTFALTVDSTPLTGVAITSSGVYGGTTDYTVPPVAYGVSVDLVAPATDPTGYTFSYWTLNGTPQGAGVKEITPTMPASAMTAVAVYAANTYALTVESTPPTGIVITSSTGDGGTTNYTVPTVAYGTSVDLVAPATDPTGGYSFSYWTLDGVSQTPGAMEITPTMPAAAMTAVAVYTVNTYALTVQSTPATGLSIGSGTGDDGTTPYTVSTVAYNTSVDLVAPATDPTGYTFAYWTLNGAEQTAALKEITPTMPASAMTAVAVYTTNTYALDVQSVPTGLAIGSDTGDGGTTEYIMPSVAYGSSVDLVAPDTDPTGYTFAYWTLNAVTQTAGLKEITFPMPASATTAVAVYTVNTYGLTVQSTPVAGAFITSDFYGGTTNYTLPSIAYGTSVDLTAPATDPSGDAFLQWTVNGVAQTAAQEGITFTMPAMATTAVAQYASYTLNVQSAPVTGVVISSVAGYGGTTNYAVPGIPNGTILDLTAPGTDPSSDTFVQWWVNGVAQTAAQATITVTMTADTTAVALYTGTSYTLSVESSPVTGTAITSSTSDGGTTTYTVLSVAYGASVDLIAPSTDPSSDTFVQWTVNGVAQPLGQQEITFTMTGDTTAVALYTIPE